MISRLPKWVEYGAFVLALIAGYVNAIGLLGFQHQSISHLSGTATLLGTQLTLSDSGNLIHLLGVLFSFLLGAMVSGILLAGTTLKLGRHYDTLLLLEGALLLLSFYWLNQGSYLGHFTASAACGMQNALATTYSGAVVRTTHMTGLFTDLGILFGEALRGRGFDRRKAFLFGLIILGFILGGTLGAMGFEALRFKALIIPALLCWALALTYFLYRVRVTK